MAYHFEPGVGTMTNILQELNAQSCDDAPGFPLDLFQLHTNGFNIRVYFMGECIWSDDDDGHQYEQVHLIPPLLIERAGQVLVQLNKQYGSLRAPKKENK